MNKTVVAQPAKATSFSPPARGILQRKCGCGTHTMGGGQCAECAKSKNPLQRKLIIGATNDPLEREADRVADHVLAAPSHSVLSVALPRILRFTGHSTGENGTAPASVDRVLASPGRPLESKLRQDMEQRFGYGFSQVRVHTGTDAEQSARDVNAHAYTVGSNIVFGHGQFAPKTHTGRRLIAHELMHVVQQSPDDKSRLGKDNERGVRPKNGQRANEEELVVTNSPLRIMRMNWAPNMRSQQMPSCGSPQYAAFPSERKELGLVPGDARANCVYTPLFHVPEFRLPDGRHRVTVRARVSRVPVQCEDQDWSINVYECFTGGSSLANGCESDTGVSYAGGSISGAPLEIIYPSLGESGLWSTRNLSVRISNGCSDPIPVNMSVEYPSIPEPTAWQQISEGLHMMLDLLGLTEPFGVFFDGLNAVIYASEGEWLQVGLSIGPSIPLAGAGIVTLRRIVRGGEEVIGMTIRREAIPLLRSEDVAAALRRARERSRGRSIEELPPDLDTARGSAELGGLPGRLSGCRRGSVICQLDQLIEIPGIRRHLSRRSDLDRYLGHAFAHELELTRSLRSAGVRVLSGEDSIARFLREVPEGSWTEGFFEAVHGAERSQMFQRVRIDGRDYVWPVDELGRPYVIHHEPPLEWLAQYADAVETLRPLPYAMHSEVHVWWNRLKTLLRRSLTHRELEALRLGEESERLPLDFSTE